MYKQIEKPKEKNSRSFSNSVTQKKDEMKQKGRFVDNRPEAITQRKLKKIANTYSALQSQPIQKTKNTTGFPEYLETGIENFSNKVVTNTQENLVSVWSNSALNNTATTQLYSATESTALIEGKYKKWRTWYFEICMPAMQTIAAKSGQSFNEYWATRSEDDFEQTLIALHTENKDETSFFEHFARAALINSDTYEGMKRVPKTNILVDPHIAEDYDGLQAFIALYNGGGMSWYRGLSVSHFSYPVLRGAGVLGSEGSADTPTFTMGNTTPTRWLPGLYDATLADAVAHSIDGGDAGLRDISTRKAIPIGVTVQYPISAPTPVAYLNDGEQVIRGPIADATIHRLILMGPGGFSYKLVGGNTSDLPPAAPYHAGVGSTGIIAWETNIDQWLLAHP